MTFPTPPPVPGQPTVYMQGTRRIDEMAANARQLCYQERYSYTEGWDDNTVGYIFNLGLNQLYDRICQIDQVANIKEYTQDVIAQVQAYDIPQDVKMSVQIMNVRYLYGPETWQFVTLEQGMIQDRFSYPTNIPNTYCIRDGQILLSPTPNISRPNALIVNYQKRMRSLDYRRGKVTNIISPNGTITNISNGSPAVVTTSTPHGLSTGDKVGIGGIFDGMPELVDETFIITVTGASTFSLNNVNTTMDGIYQPAPVGLWYLNPVQFQLNFNVVSQKDVNLQANANSILDKIDWVTFVDRNGSPIIDAIPLTSYNMTTFVLTADSDYVIPYTSWLVFTGILANEDIVYVISGDYASTHSELDRQSEDLLIEYVVLRLLRLQSAAEPSEVQMAAENAVLDRLAISYRRYRPSIVPIVYQQRLRTRSWFWGGRGPS
jgi:hypothetical protein